jgi:hypothetical protein
MNEPVSISIAIGGVLSTGVALAAVFIPNLDPPTQGLIIAFGNAVILAGSAIWARARSTPVANPTLASGTPVTVVSPDPAVADTRVTV